MPTLLLALLLTFPWSRSTMQSHGGMLKMQALVNSSGTLTLLVQCNYQDQDCLAAAPLDEFGHRMQFKGRSFGSFGQREKYQLQVTVPSGEDTLLIPTMRIAPWWQYQLVLDSDSPL